MQIELADNLPQAWQYWRDWHQAIAPGNTLEIEALETDQGRCLTYTRVIARRDPDAVLEDPILSIPADYTYKPLLRP